MSLHLVPEQIALYAHVGGMRMEDVITVTEDGFENFTLVPRSVDEIESVMSGGDWPPKHDSVPWLRRKWY